MACLAGSDVRHAQCLLDLGVTSHSIPSSSATMASGGGSCPARSCGKVLVIWYVATPMGFHDDQVVRPGNFSNQWLESFIGMVFHIKLPHVPEVLHRKPCRARELPPQV